MKLYDVLQKTIQTYAEGNAFELLIGDALAVKSYEEFGKDLSYMIDYISSIPEQRVAILGFTTYPRILTQVAIVVSGKDAILVDSTLDVNDMKQLMMKADAQAVVVAGELQDVAGELVNEDDIVKVYAMKEDISQYIEKQIILPETEGKIITFTSGTSKMAKGVELNTSAFCKCIQNMSSSLEGSKGEKAYLPVPFYHVYGHTTVFSSLLSGMTVCIGNGMKSVKKDVKIFQPDLLIIVPSILDYLIKVKGIPESVKYILVAGSMCKVEYEEILKERGIFLQNAYGLSEVAGGIAANKKGNSISKMTPMRGCVFSTTADSELCVETDYVMDGYYKEIEATEEVVKKGVFFTGDEGFIDEDGDIHITGRLKDIIAMENGEKIYCVETDEILSAMDKVTEAAVFEVDGYLVAAIVANSENAEMIQQEIARYNTTQPYIRRIQKIWFRKEPLPRTSIGKMKRARIKEEYMKESNY